MKKGLWIIGILLPVIVLSTVLTGCTGGTMVGRWDMMMTRDIFLDMGLYDPQRATKTIDDMMQSYRFVIEITDDSLFITMRFVDGVLDAASGEFFTMTGNNMHLKESNTDVIVKLTGNTMTLTYKNGTVIVLKRIPDDEVLPIDTPAPTEGNN